MSNQPTQAQMVQAIGQQTEQHAMSIYQGTMTDLTFAAALANLPNWRETLEAEFAGFSKVAEEYATDFKDKAQHQVPPEALLEIRGAVTDGVTAAQESAMAHKNRLIDLIEMLRGEKTSGIIVE